MIAECTNCGGNQLKWIVDSEGPHDVVDGRIRMSEVHAIAFLACEECSETLAIIDEDEINAMLNNSYYDNPKGRPLRKSST